MYVLESPCVRHRVRTEGGLGWCLRTLPPDPPRGRQVSWKHGILHGFYFASANPKLEILSDGTTPHSLRRPQSQMHQVFEAAFVAARKSRQVSETPARRREAIWLHCG